MPLHDYLCACGAFLDDQYRSIEEGGQARPPICDFCGQKMAWIPAVGSMDAFEPGQEFETTDGQGNRVLIENFAQMKKLERESEQQYRNGEGQPLRFRRLHNGRSNRDVNTFGEVPQEKPTEEAAERFGLKAGGGAIETKGEGPPDVAFGPGVNESNASALKGGL